MQADEVCMLCVSTSSAHSTFSKKSVLQSLEKKYRYNSGS
jgi:hypothetical protein